MDLLNFLNSSCSASTSLTSTAEKRKKCERINNLWRKILDQEKKNNDPGHRLCRHKNVLRIRDQWISGRDIALTVCLIGNANKILEPEVTGPLTWASTAAILEAAGHREYEGLDDRYHRYTGCAKPLGQRQRARALHKKKNRWWCFPTSDSHKQRKTDEYKLGNGNKILTEAAPEVGRSIVDGGEKIQTGRRRGRRKNPPITH